MTLKMKMKLNKYWEDIEKINRLLIAAVILGPRYKLDIIAFWVRCILGNEPTERFIASLKLDIEDLYNPYSND